MNNPMNNPMSNLTSSLLEVTDLDAAGVRAVLDASERDVAELGRPLDGQGVAMVFEKPSNRTRHATEMAVVQLGGHPVYTRGKEVGFDRREPVEDIARVMSGYHAVIAARVLQHSTLERLAKAADVPVVNLLSDHSHPMQALADALTMRQQLGELGGKTVAYVGDYNNVARSLAEIAMLCDMDVRIGSPRGYGPDPVEVARLGALGTASVSAHTKPQEAVAGAHAVHTDTWVSMGQESDRAARRAAFEGWTVDDDLMSLADPDAIFMHCLPAYRGLEVSESVIDGPRSMVIPQAHNRMHAARGALWSLTAASA